MQLFLLMILSTFLGGYYYLNSPSLELDNSFLSETVQLKTHVMCIINEHKNALDDNAKNLREHGYEFEQSTPCAISKNIQTKKFCLTDGALNPNCYAQEEDTYTAQHYFISAVDVPADFSQKKLLETVKDLSEGTGSIGLLFKTDAEEFVILNPQTQTSRILVPTPLIGANSLRTQQLVYMTQHIQNEVEAITENAERVALECADPTDIKVFDPATQMWNCRDFESQKKCFGDLIEDVDGNCVPNPLTRISCGDKDIVFNADAQAWECVRRSSETCQPGERLLWDNTIPGYDCFPFPPEEGSEDCEELEYDETTGVFTGTRIGGSIEGYPCGSCETQFQEDGGCSEGCVPGIDRVDHPLCAGSCAFDNSQNMWETECGSDNNCALYKTIYWSKSLAKWRCIDCYPLKIKKKFKQGDSDNAPGCLTATIPSVLGQGNDGTCPLTSYDYALPSGQSEDNYCLIKENETLGIDNEVSCAFSRPGGFSDSDPYGEKNYFCDIEDIDDNVVCSEFAGNQWFWFDPSGGCYDPYDGDESLQTDSPLIGGAITYSESNVNVSFGCPLGFERPRVNGALQACRKTQCTIAQHSLPNLGNNDIPYDARFKAGAESIPTDETICEDGYVEHLNTAQGCFYCWRPPVDYDPANSPPTVASAFEVSENVFVRYFGLQETTRNLQFGAATSIFQFLDPNPNSTPTCLDFDETSGYCIDTHPSHQAPQGWKWTWAESNDTWSWSTDPAPDWCNTNYPDGSLGWTTSEERCPKHYQTKLLGGPNADQEILDACLYCMPEPFSADKVTVLQPDNNIAPQILNPQQPGTWQLNDCDPYDQDIIPENVYLPLEDITPPSDYADGSSYAYSTLDYCGVDSGINNCPAGLKATFDPLSGWSPCQINWCRGDDNILIGAITENKRQTGINKYISVLTTRDSSDTTNGPAGEPCVYMWLPPYNISTWETYKTTHAFDITIIDSDNITGDLNFLDQSTTSCTLDTDGYCKDSESFSTYSRGFQSNWTHPTGWGEGQEFWCDGEGPGDYKSQYPYTARIQDDDDDNECDLGNDWCLELTLGSGIWELCLKESQPSPTIWNETCGSIYTIGNNIDFKNCLFTQCDNNGFCLEKANELANNNSNDLPIQQAWSITSGWDQRSLRLCGTVLPPTPANKFDLWVFSQTGVTGNWCADVWKPSYVDWLAQTPAYYENFIDIPDLEANPTKIYTCGATACVEHIDNYTNAQTDQCNQPWINKQNILYRKWGTLSGGWSMNDACLVNWVNGAQESDYNTEPYLLIKGQPESNNLFPDSGAIPNGTNEEDLTGILEAVTAPPAPHLFEVAPVKTINQVRIDCNGSAATDDCFYESGYTHGNPIQYEFESSDTATCPTTEDWDNIMTFDSLSGWSGCDARDCILADVPNIDSGPTGDYKYINDYYGDHTAYDGNNCVADGFKPAGIGFGPNLQKNCRYCRININVNKCTQDMITYYDQNDEVFCAFPSPPACGSGQSIISIDYDKTLGYLTECSGSNFYTASPTYNSSFSYSCMPGLWKKDNNKNDLYCTDPNGTDCDTATTGEVITITGLNADFLYCPLNGTMSGYNP